MDNKNRKTRREFLEVVVWTGSAVAVGGLACLSLPGKSRGAGRDTLDIISMTKIDPEMILYEEVHKPVSTGFNESRSITVDASGILYLAGDQAVRVMDSRGRIKDTLKLNLTPFCLVPADSQFYIGVRDRIVITDKKGKVQTKWDSLGDNAWITSVAIDNDLIFIADAGQRVVWCYNLKGNFIRRIGEKNPDRNIPGFVIPGPYFDLAMAPDGLLRIANPGNHRIEAYTVKGDREFAWGQFGNRLEDFSACCNPVSFTILPGGDIITCEKGVARVKIYDTFGKLKGFVADPKQLANVSSSVASKTEKVQRYGFDVAADSEGHVFILDRTSNVLRFFKKK